MNMELDDMKNLWQKMDATIQKQQAMNEQLIKNMLHERRENNTMKIINTEFAGMVACIFILLVLLTMGTRIGSHTGVLVCYGVSLLVTVFAIVFALYKIKYLKALDAGNDNVSTMAEKVERFRMIIAKERLVSLLLGPALIGVLLVVAMYVAIGLNILDDPGRYLLLFVTATAAFYALVILLYKKLYFTPLRNIANNLREIAEFKAQ